MGIFLIANETLLDLQKNRHGTAEESIDIRDFYSRCLVDPAGAVVDQDLFYDTPYFNQELKKRVGVSVAQGGLRIAFDHFVHVLSKDPAVFDLRHPSQRKCVLLLKQFRLTGISFGVN